MQMNGGYVMNKLLKNYFALTDKGVEDLKKASFLSFLSYIMNIAPAILLMLFAEQAIEGKIKSNLTYLFLSIGIFILMWILLNKEYVAHFDNTYKESGNLRIEIADIISKLPLSYFSKYNLSDLSQTIMSDVEKIEHSLSHSIPKLLGFIIFFPIISFMLLLGNFKLGLTIIFIVLLSLSLIVLSKNFQIKNATKYYNILRENSEAFQEAIELHQEIKSYGLTDKIKNPQNYIEEGETPVISEEKTVIDMPENKKLTEEEKEIITQKVNESIEAYNKYLEKNPNAPEKDSIESRISSLKSELNFEQPVQ